MFPVVPTVLVDPEMLGVRHSLKLQRFGDSNEEILVNNIPSSHSSNA